MFTVGGGRGGKGGSIGREDEGRGSLWDVLQCVRACRGCREVLLSEERTAGKGSAAKCAEVDGRGVGRSGWRRSVRTRRSVQRKRDRMRE